MGWGIGIGIGWGSISKSNQGQMVYYLIEQFCSGGAIAKYATTQLVDNSIYQPGDYVNLTDKSDRVLLGEAYTGERGPTYYISGPVYTNCP